MYTYNVQAKQQPCTLYLLQCTAEILRRPSRRLAALTNLASTSLCSMYLVAICQTHRNGLKFGWDIPIMMDIICPLPLPLHPAWNRVEVYAKSWLGRMPNVLLCSGWHVCWGNSYVQMNANYLFSKKKSSTTCHCIRTCLESLGIFQA